MSVPLPGTTLWGGSSGLPQSSSPHRACRGICLTDATRRYQFLSFMLKGFFELPPDFFLDEELLLLDEEFFRFEDELLLLDEEPESGQFLSFMLKGLDELELDDLDLPEDEELLLFEEEELLWSSWRR